MDDNVIPFPESDSGNRHYCAEELTLLHMVADWLNSGPPDWARLAESVEDHYPYFLDCYRVSKLMNPSNPNPTRSALRAARHRAARDRT